MNTLDKLKKIKEIRHKEYVFEKYSKYIYNDVNDFGIDSYTYQEFIEQLRYYHYTTVKHPHKFITYISKEFEGIEIKFEESFFTEYFLNYSKKR